MTIIGDRLQRATAHARRVKEEHVREVKGKKGLTDIFTLVEAWRGDEVVGTVFTAPDRDRMLSVANGLSRGWGADMLVLTIETYMALDMEADELTPDHLPAINSLTGQPWGPGDLGEYFEHHGPDNGYVTEGLGIMAFNRAGDEASASLPYRIRGRTVEWLKEPDFNGASSAGVVPNAMREIMGEDTMMQVLGPAYLRLGPDEESRQASADVLTLEAMRKQIVDKPDSRGNYMPLFAMMFAVPGSKRHQILRERLERTEVVDPRRWN